MLKHYKLDIALVIAMAIWGSNFVVSKAATEIFPPMGYNAMRFSLATLSMWIVLRLMHVDLYVPRREWGAILLCAFVGNTLYQLFFINAVHLTSASNSVLIVSAGPVWVVLFNAARSQERITRGAVVGVGLALTGVVAVIVGRYGDQLAGGVQVSLGDGLMVVASVLWAGSILTSRRPLKNNPHLVATFWMLACGAASQVVFGLPSLVGFDWGRFSASGQVGGAVFAVIYSGVISIVFGSIIFNYAVNKLGSARTSIYTYVQPLVTAILAVIVLGERFTPAVILGALLIFGGVALVRRA